MSLLPWIWLFSMVAAAAFFTSGFLFGRRGQARLAEAQAEVVRLQNELMNREGALNPRPRARNGSLRNGNGADGRRAFAVPDRSSSLDGPIEILSHQPGHEGIVVADEQGFPIVGFGNEQEQLAALCGVVHELDLKARNLLKVGSTERVSMETQSGLTISACSIDFEGSSLTLATTTKGPGLETAELRSALETFRNTLLEGDYRKDRQEITT
ncbi:MAG: hypothetical protein AAFU79_21675 [Myxococcota bacterium]